jgi:hypothetical protein
MEGLAVLAGILIAFGIDAGWDGHVERRQADAYLSALAAELDVAGTGYADHLWYLDLHDQRLGRILAEAQSYSGNPAAMDTLLLSLGPFASYNPPMAAFDDLEGGGGLASIEPAEVRRGIASYRRSVERDGETQRELADYWNTEVKTYWDERIDMRRLVEIATGRPIGEFLASDLPPVRLGPNYEELLFDRRFLNQLSTWALHIARIRRSNQGMRTEIESLQALIRSR